MRWSDENPTQSQPVSQGVANLPDFLFWKGPEPHFLHTRTPAHGNPCMQRATHLKLDIFKSRWFWKKKNKTLSPLFYLGHGAPPSPSAGCNHKASSFSKPLLLHSTFPPHQLSRPLPLSILPSRTRGGRREMIMRRPSEQMLWLVSRKGGR